MNIAVILAGGTGSRIGSDLPKQFIKVCDKEIIIHTLEKFENNINIDRLIVVIQPLWKNYFIKLLQKYDLKKVSAIIDGGNTRQSSSYNALKHINKTYYQNNNALKHINKTYYQNNNALKHINKTYYQNNVNCSENEIIVLIHDAVRPFVDDNIINNCIEKTVLFDSCCVAVKSIDTIVKAENSIITDIPKRKQMFNEQTPQGFRFQIIWEAYNNAQNSGDLDNTDDVSFIHKLGKKVYIAEGTYHNIKITNSLDLYLAEKILKEGASVTTD